MCNKGVNIAELFAKTVATTKCFDKNLQKVFIYNFTYTSNLSNTIPPPPHAKRLQNVYHYIYKNICHLILPKRVTF